MSCFSKKETNEIYNATRGVRCVSRVHVFYCLTTVSKLKYPLYERATLYTETIGAYPHLRTLGYGGISPRIVFSNRSDLNLRRKKDRILSGPNNPWWYGGITDSFWFSNSCISVALTEVDQTLLARFLMKGTCAKGLM